MKQLGFILLMFCTFNIKAQNLIINGSFEDNNVIGSDCKTDLSNFDYNSLMNYSAAFSQYGSSENQIFFKSCTAYNGTIVSDDIVYEGNYSIFLGNIDTLINITYYEKYAALSLSLSLKNYKLVHFID